MVVDDNGLHLEWLKLILLVSVQQHIVHSETPRVEVFIVPAINIFGTCSDMVELGIDFNWLYALYVNVVLLQPRSRLFLLSWNLRDLWLGLLINVVVVVVVWVLADILIRLYFDFRPTQIHLLIYFSLQSFFLLLIRVNVLIVLAHTQLSVIILPTSEQLSRFTEKYREIGASCHVNDVFLPELLYFDVIWALLVTIDAQLALLVKTPAIICPTATLLNLSNSMIATTPKVLHIIETNAIKGQAALEFMSLVNSSPNCVSFRFTPDEDLATNQDSAVVAARHNFSQFRLRIMTVVDFVDIEQNWSFNGINHLLSPHVLVVAGKVDHSCSAACEN
jgi:hypothetical protein